MNDTDTATRPGVHTAILVEGTSDVAALEVLARRLGRDLDAEGIALVSLGGAMSVATFVTALGPEGKGLRLAGLCDAAEARFFARAFASAGLDAAAIFTCDADLEDELIRAIGVERVVELIEANGDGRQLRTFQTQPAKRDVALHEQLHRFFGTTSGRKAKYAAVLSDAVELDRIPRALSELLAYV